MNLKLQEELDARDKCIAMKDGELEAQCAQLQLHQNDIQERNGIIQTLQNTIHALESQLQV